MRKIMKKKLKTIWLAICAFLRKKGRTLFWLLVPLILAIVMVPPLIQLIYPSAKYPPQSGMVFPYIDSGMPEALKQFSQWYEYVKKADEEVGAKRFLSAESLYHEAYKRARRLKEDYLSGFTLFRLGVLYGTQEDRDTEAYDKFVKAEGFLSKTEGSLLIKTINNIAISDFKLGKLESALNNFERAKKLDPSFGPAFNGLGVVYFRKRDFKEAEDNLGEALNLGYTEALPNRGTLYLYLGYYDRAITDFEEAIRRGYKRWDVYNGLARVYQESGKSKEALSNFNESIKVRPNAVAFNNRGTIFAQQEQYEKALADYAEAIELDPLFVGARMNRGSVYYSLGQYDQAIDDFSSALGTEEADFTRESVMQTSWGEIKGYEYSSSDLASLVHIGALLIRGNCYLRKEEYDLAMKDFTKVTEKDSDNFMGWYSLGTLYLGQRQYDQAKSYLEKARTLNPKFVPAYLNEASACLEIEDYEQSITLFGEAIELDDKLAFAYMGRGTSYLFAGQLSEAVEDLSKTLELDPANTKAHLNLGTAYAITKKYDEAEKIFKKVIEEKPGEKMAYLNLLNLYAITKQRDRIEEIMAKTRELNLSLEGKEDRSVGIISTLVSPKDYFEYKDRAR